MATLVDDDVVIAGDLSAGIGDPKTELPGRVAQWYYRHGLFLSSYPVCATSIAVVVILLSCYPLLNIPMPGTTPTKIMLPRSMNELPSLSADASTDEAPHPARHLFNFSFDTTPFSWDRAEPFMYVQQIVFRSQVIPWLGDGQMQLTDAFRGPLHEVFKLLETVRNHEDPQSKTTLSDVCLHVENVKRRDKSDLFPEYNCLVLSPANFWQQSVHNFNQDNNLLNTIFHNHNLMKSKVSTAEMLIGFQLRDTGIKRYPIRVRPRTIQYAITIVMKHYDNNFIESLREKLIRMYPLHQPPVELEATITPPDINSEPTSYVMYVYYPGEFNWLEFTPLFFSFIMLFIYVYFSIRKINVIKSRAVLATCAVITVFSSLMMSLGICFFFDLTTRMQSKGVFQYLIILLGLENVLVITKSVLSTDHTFDVKIRVAQGLSKEGWTISKTLLTEITILTIGLATFVPVIQEFCVFAIVGLISDFFLQMMLFSTVLAMDIKRVDVSDLRKVSPNTVDNHTRRTPFRNSTITPSMTINRSRSHPKLTALDTPSDMVVSNGPTSPTKPGDKNSIPKRIRIVNFWARTRFFQRAFMLWMIVWIGSIIYNSRILEQLFVLDSNGTDAANPTVPSFVGAFLRNKNNQTNAENVINPDHIVTPIPPTLHNQRTTPYITEGPFNVTDQMHRLKHSDYDSHFFLSNFHWSAILRQYNLSLSGRYVAVLPAIKLSHAIPAADAIRIRNPTENPIQHFQWKALAVALDPIDFTDLDADVDLALGNAAANLQREGSLPLYPKSPMEILLASILCAISVSVMAYTMVVFYRCICTRNYAEWRSSWNDTDIIHPKRQRILEGVPILVRGHTHRIECLVTDGEVVASSCLDGQVKLWDINNGELIASIDRNGYFRMNQQLSVAATQEVTAAVQRVKRLVQTNESWSPIWCLDYLDNLIVIGCADGRLEFWEASTGNLKCIYESEPDQAKSGVTNLKLAGNRVIAARLSGRVDFLRLESYTQGRQIDWGFTSAYRRTHVRAGSTGSMKSFMAANSAAGSSINPKEELRCILEQQQQGHQQPLTCMDVIGGTVFTGSQDHTLKVFELDSCQLLFTLHGHCGPITCLFIDHYQPDTGGSGSQDGLLCVWELLTGACMYSIQAHDGAVVSLVCAPSYVISVGSDERLCVWERFQGHLLNTINVTHIYTSLLMLTPSLLVTGKPGSLIVWDVRSGEPTREVKLDCANMHVTPKMLLPAAGSVVCDYGNELRIVRFPLIADKRE